MPINQLIARGGTGIKSPIQRYIETKQQMAQEDQNRLAQQATRQSMGFQREQQMRAQQAHQAAQAQNYAKSITPLIESANRATNKQQAYEAVLPQIDEIARQHGMDTKNISGQWDQTKADALLSQYGAKEKEYKPSYKVVPERVKGGMWRDRAIIDGKKAGFVGEAYKKGAGASETTLGGGKYAAERMKIQAKRMDEIEKSATSAYSGKKALDRFVRNSKKGTEGGAQPIISGVKNFLTSFSSYSPDELTSTAVMQQAIGEVKVGLIARFGARGLTDKDMEIINESLPRVATSKDAREKVAEILGKIYEYQIEEYSDALEQEKELHPEVSKGIIKPKWLREYSSKKKDENETSKKMNDNPVIETRYLEDGRKIIKKADGSIEIM